MFAGNFALSALVVVIAHFIFPQLILVESLAISLGSGLVLWIFGRNVEQAVAQPGGRVHLSASGDIAVVCSTCAVARGAAGWSDRPEGEWSDPMGFDSFDVQAAENLAEKLNGSIHSQYGAAVTELDRVVSSKSLSKSLGDVLDEIQKKEQTVQHAEDPLALSAPAEQNPVWRFGAKSARTFTVVEPMVLEETMPGPDLVFPCWVPRAGGGVVMSWSRVEDERASLELCRNEIVVVTRETADRWLVRLSETENADTRTIAEKYAPWGGKCGNPSTVVRMSTETLKTHGDKLAGRGISGVLEEYQSSSPLRDGVMSTLFSTGGDPAIIAALTRLEAVENLGELNIDTVKTQLKEFQRVVADRAEMAVDVHIRPGRTVLF